MINFTEEPLIRQGLTTRVSTSNCYEFETLISRLLPNIHGGGFKLRGSGSRVRGVDREDIRHHIVLEVEGHEHEAGS